MRIVSYEESLTITLNLHQKMDVYIAHPWCGTTQPAWPEKSLRLTPEQAIAEYYTCQRRSGCCWVALKAVSANNRVFDISTLRNAVRSTKNWQRTSGISRYSRPV